MKTSLIIGILVLLALAVRTAEATNAFFVDLESIGMPQPPVNDVWNFAHPMPEVMGWQVFTNSNVPPQPGRPGSAHAPNTGNLWFFPEQWGMHSMLPFMLEDWLVVDAADLYCGDAENGTSGQFFFSVDRYSQGQPGRGVNLVYWSTHTQASSIFYTLAGSGWNDWCLDGPEIGLAPPGEEHIGDNINAYDYCVGYGPDYWLLFSVDPYTANYFGVSPGDVFGWDFVLGEGGYLWTAAELGLEYGDDIDALVYLTTPFGGWEGDYADFPIAFSLARNSPTLINNLWSAADILLSDGNGNVILPEGCDAAHLGLMPSDNIDALDAFEIVGGDSAQQETRESFETPPFLQFGSYRQLSWERQSDLGTFMMNGLDSNVVPEPGTLYMLLSCLSVAGVCLALRERNHR